LIRHFAATYFKRWLFFVPLLAVILLIPPGSLLEKALVVPVLSVLMALGLAVEWVVGSLLERLRRCRVTPSVAEARLRGESLRSTRRFPPGPPQ
jgi:hypothetical protein